MTLYHKEIIDKDGEKVAVWQRFILNNCFYRKRTRQISRDGQVKSPGQSVARIPALGLGVVPQVGDIAVLGKCEIDLPEGSGGRQVLDLENSFSAGVVRVNTYNGLPLPHFYLSEDWRYANRG